MPYTKVTWDTSALLSAENMNHLETQYDQFVIDYGSHNHDDLYYTQTESDSRFFYAGNITGFDADKLDGQDAEDIVSVALPYGAILYWSGIESTIPEGWYICNGATHNGYATPDLRNRFIVGAGHSFTVNATGGANTFTPTSVLTIAGHQLTIAEFPAHSHTYTEAGALNQTRYGTNYAHPSSIATAITTDTMSTGDGAHGHPGSTISFNPQDTRPPYYALFYIIKCG